MATMNQSSEAAASGIGGWFEGVSYQAGLSGGSWATGSFVANGGILPTDLVNQVSESGSGVNKMGTSGRRVDMKHMRDEEAIGVQGGRPPAGKSDALSKSCPRAIFSAGVERGEA
jgi:hypothetical protein